MFVSNQHFPHQVRYVCAGLTVNQERVASMPEEAVDLSKLEVPWAENPWILPQGFGYGFSLVS
jgi:hypothetical protein